MLVRHSVSDPHAVAQYIVFLAKALMPEAHCGEVTIWDKKPPVDFTVYLGEESILEIHSKPGSLSVDVLKDSGAPLAEALVKDLIWGPDWLFDDRLTADYDLAKRLADQVRQ